VGKKRVALDKDGEVW